MNNFFNLENPLISLLFFLSLAYTSSEIKLLHKGNRDFELFVPNKIKFQTAYVYNNIVDMSSETTRKNFAIEGISTNGSVEKFEFTLPEHMYPNLYYGVCLKNENGQEFFSNRYYLGKDGKFYVDKSYMKTKKSSDAKTSSKWEFNWYVLSIIGLVAIGLIAIAALVYIFIKKYKKRQLQTSIAEISDTDQRQVQLE